MITHGNIAWVATQIPNFSLVENVKSKEPQFLSYLPLCHIFGRLIDLLVASHTMATINFAESIDTVQSDLVEIQPTIFSCGAKNFRKNAFGSNGKDERCNFSKTPTV